jgi:polar amino acid transport system substrate-binding protein
MIKMDHGSNWRRAAGFACAVLLGGSAVAGQVKVRVIAQQSSQPKWIIEHGAVQGLCPDLLAAIERIEPKLHFSGYDRARSLPAIEDALERGKTDVACGIVDSARRRDIAIRSAVPLYEVRHRLAAAAADLQPVDNFDDLVRLHPLINTARGSAFIAQLKERGLEVDETTGDNVVNLRKILHGHGRYTYMNELTLKYLIRVEHLENKVRILPAVFNEDYVYFWTSKHADPAVAPLIDGALLRLKANGELARIYDRWVRIK